MDQEPAAREERLSAFKVELEKLLSATSASERDARELLETFMHRGYSALGKNSTWASKSVTKTTTSYRCENEGCTFRLRLLGDGTTFRFALGQNGVADHTGHALEKPARATGFVISYIKEQTQELRADGRSGLDLVTSIGRQVTALGIDVPSATINYARRTLEKEKLTARAFADVDTPYILSLGDSFFDARSGDVDPAAAAIFGMLSKLQSAHPTAYQRVCVDQSNCISYIFGSLPVQRERGSLFGSVRLFDDKHGVSSSAYHLHFALCLPTRDARSLRGR
jgi:hypothetical protein